jgi:hypothetical protein
MPEQELIQTINKELSIELPVLQSMEALRLLLAEKLNWLIQHDFQRLVHILYRIDVNERKLKFLLQENVGEDAALIMADLIIERQSQKIASRRQTKINDENISDEEKW